MAKEYNYEVELKWDRDRKGTLSSSVLDQTVEVATPPEFPNGMEGFWSPEHLFVASVSSCLMTTFLAIAENSRLEFSDLNVNGTGKLEKVDGKLMVREITLNARVEIPDEKDRERAERILHKAESACLISNSINSKIIFNTEIIVSELI